MNILFSVHTQDASQDRLSLSPAYWKVRRVKSWEMIRLYLGARWKQGGSIGLAEMEDSLFCVTASEPIHCIQRKNDQSAGEPIHCMQRERDQSAGEPMHCIQRERDQSAGEPIHCIERERDQSAGEPIHCIQRERYKSEKINKFLEWWISFINV